MAIGFLLPAETRVNSVMTGCGLEFSRRGPQLLHLGFDISRERLTLQIGIGGIQLGEQIDQTINAIARNIVGSIEQLPEAVDDTLVLLPKIIRAGGNVGFEKRVIRLPNHGFRVVNGRFVIAYLIQSGLDVVRDGLDSLTLLFGEKLSGMLLPA